MFSTNLLLVVLSVDNPILVKEMHLVTRGPFIAIRMSLRSYSTNEKHVSQVDLQVVVSIVVSTR